MIHIYAIVFLVGVLGLLAQTLLGMAGGHGGHSHAHAGHAHSHGGHAHGRATQPTTRGQSGAAGLVNCC